jgi:acetylornithine deacetylase/succinyl-diaminopimelate desuccinylase-like protein
LWTSLAIRGERAIGVQTYGTSFNLDGIWGGNMFANAAGAILPNKITSKHNIRYVPNVNGEDLVKKIRAQLDRNGYKDVELKVIGDVRWSVSDPHNALNDAATRTFDSFGVTSRRIMAANHLPDESELGGYWPSYLFNNGRVGQRVAPKVLMPIGGGAVGNGRRAHAANEFYVIEGAGKTYGMAGAEKSIATVVYNFAGWN